MLNAPSLSGHRHVPIGTELAAQSAQQPSETSFKDLLRTTESSSESNRDPVAANDEELQEVFQSFVGETFFGQVLSAMRKTVGKPAYMHGGRGEEVFQAQLDQILSQHMSKASADSFSGPMFELFQLGRQAG